MPVPTPAMKHGLEPCPAGLTSTIDADPTPRSKGFPPRLSSSTGFAGNGRIFEFSAGVAPELVRIWTRQVGSFCCPSWIGRHARSQDGAKIYRRMSSSSAGLGGTPTQMK